MGWRADRAYEQEQAKAFQEWKASLTWREYLSWQWDRHRHFLAGAASAVVVIALVWWVAG